MLRNCRVFSARSHKKHRAKRRGILGSRRRTVNACCNATHQLPPASALSSSAGVRPFDFLRSACGQDALRLPTRSGSGSAFRRNGYRSSAGGGRSFRSGRAARWSQRRPAPAWRPAVLARRSVLSRSQKTARSQERWTNRPARPRTRQGASSYRSSRNLPSLSCIAALVAGSCRLPST